MRSFVRFIKANFLFLCCFANLHLRAESGKLQDRVNLGKIQSGVVQEPRNCLLKAELVCGLKTGQSPRVLYYQGSEFYLGENTILIRKGESRWYLQKGGLWLRSEESVAIETRYSEVIGSSVGLSVMVEISTSVGDIVTPLEVPSIVRPKGSESLFSFPVGMEVNINGRDQDGISFIRIPRSSHPKTVIEKWSRLFPGSPAELARAVSVYREKWQAEADRLATQHKEIYQRQVASHAERMRMRELRRKRYEDESRRLRTIFRSKNYY